MRRSEVMVQEVLSVPEVTCQHCISAIEGAVGALDGVEAVRVDLDRKDVAIRYDGARVAPAMRAGSTSLTSASRVAVTSTNNRPATATRVTERTWSSG